MTSSAYLALISIGGQEMEVIFDTGSADLWVVSSNCTQTDCAGVAKYSSTPTLSLSDTPFKLGYLIGSVSGLVGFETIAVGSYQITPQVFAVANDTQGLDLSAAGDSGIMGFAFPGAASIPSTSGKTIVENLFSYFDDAHRFFAFQLGGDLTNSSFTLGELDPAFANSTNDLTYTPVYTGHNVDLDYWKLPLHAINLNSSTSFSGLAPSRVVGSPTPIAVLDTGTTFILGPSSDVDAFWDAVGGSRKTDSGTWQVKCNRAVTVGFMLGQDDSIKEYIVDPRDISYREGSPADDWCTGGIQSSDSINSGDWILGDTFLRNVYVTHHGAASGRPPLIGLLNLTDPDSALERFQSERGDDPLSPMQGRGDVRTRHGVGHVLSAGTICGIVLVGAFLVGALAAWLFQAIKVHLARKQDK
ncbi:acid protease [Auriscalpium vulgare]|uniref:Acid protease n=1 Tax=Auriscalpium vulgare TaxID=40419 RepID=A0ACB8SCZ8_9AGAM|nr:acid protease [Auriscalpium vulgare]